MSTAIPERNPEYVEAVSRGLRILRRAEMLAFCARGERFIAVAGTHGKTTTSSMVALALRGAGIDPTYIIGGELNDTGANARSGSGGIFVAEADESDGSFLSLEPDAALVTNMEADHLDHYSGEAEILEAFSAFMSKLAGRGVCIVCSDAPGLVESACATGAEVWAYGILAPSAAAGRDIPWYELRELELTPGGSRFELRTPSGETHRITLQVPGAHNAVNAAGAFAAAIWAGADGEGAARGLSSFTGVKRRFQRVATVDGVEIVDDYAHHPTEVAATLGAARTFEPHRLVAVFQPHRYSRTEHLAVDFGGAFHEADIVVMTDVYGAGEYPIPGVTGKLLVDSVIDSQPGKTVAYMPRRDGLASFLAGLVRPGDMVLTMGAGDIGSLGEELAAELERA